ncbi:hypothetical protein NGA_0396700 [Nannochloropsis gaditana CCMP526]|uniref:uncharacterized protein n=1 Tax=Nannochloropsis gaditana (strain CCMP526) TaxID=1093141 RepID=UPI00029F7FA7|nr:hypothetical protein NGA_0396700 [Nannochloropsis gaditana CCMP526]EKU21324.1 hypothetical protein NGA_0396700 [Nannochloropsis gaditana CCMP526]|eukprot:XP_005855039.1 hypothetical protein NGA_0396700 [Nannochloropsis gaditana CCMP526]
MVDEEGGHPGLSGAQQAFPGLEALLTVPFSFIAKYTHNKKEAEALVQISLLAVRLDSLLDSLRVAADHAATLASPPSSPYWTSFNSNVGTT